MRSGYSTTTPRRENTKPSQSLLLTSISTSRPNIHDSKIMLCIWWDQKDLVYYELLKPGDSITDDRYRLQLIRLSYALRKRPEHEQRHDKIILFHDNARPHTVKVVKKIFENAQMGCFTASAVFSGLRLLITGYSEGCSKSPVHFFRRNWKLAPKLDRLQRQVIFLRWNSKIAWEMGKNSRQRWTIL